MDFMVEYYEKADGSRPAEEFILSQDNKMQAKIFAALELLELKGQHCENHIPSRWVTAFSKSGQSRGLTSAECCISL